MSGTKLFWITQKWPLPVEDGARQATFHLARSLASAGTPVHLLAIVPRGEKTDAEQAKRTFGVERMSVVFREPSRHLKSLATRPWEPLTFAPYMSRRLADEILAIHRAWDEKSVIVFDGLHGAGWYFRLNPEERSRLRIAHRSHNVESNLWKLGAKQRSFPQSVFLDYQARLVSAFESRVCHASRLVATVSANDEVGLKDLYGRGIRTTVAPIGVPLAGDGGGSGFPSAKKLLFVGKLDWDPNRDGLRWFLEQVWPEAVKRSPELSLTIVGAGDGAWLKPYLGLPRLEFLGRVPELAPHYRAACACLVPIFFGSGTRVKAIEAASFARPCISTEQWIDAICGLTLEDAQARGRAAFARISDAFDPSKVAARFLRDLENSL
jgi:glycosyltransferase involved in cell wall biosynthesis